VRPGGPATNSYEGLAAPAAPRRAPEESPEPSGAIGTRIEVIAGTGFGRPAIVYGTLPAAFSGPNPLTGILT